MTTNNTMGQAFDNDNLAYGRTDDQLAEELGMPLDRYAALRNEPIPIGAMAGWRSPDGQLSYRPVLASREGIERLARRYGANADRLKEIMGV